MNDYKNNWFYRMCSKQGAKNIVYIVVGVLLLVVGILLFTAVVSVLNVLLSIFGILMIVQGASSMFSKMPKLKELMERMPADDFSSLGNFPPQQMYYSTFYCTERYLCAPASYSLIRYDRIKNMSSYSVTISRGGQKQYFLNIEFTDGSPAVDINIKDYGTFLKEADSFMGMIEHYRAELLSEGSY